MNWDLFRASKSYAEPYFLVADKSRVKYYESLETLFKNHNHIPNATANPIQGAFILKAPKNATVAIIQTTKNKMTFIIVAKIKF